MRVSFKSVLASGLLLGMLSATASADLIVGSINDQSGVVTPQVGGGALYGLTTYDYTTAIDINGNGAYSYITPDLVTNVFPAANYTQLTSITQITVNVSILDADSGPGEFANNNLVLILDGINTGLVLNDVNPNQGIIASLTLSNNPALAGALLAALQADGKLVAQILDTSAGATPADPDFPNDFIGLPSSLQTSLEIQGAFAGPGPSPIPLPAAVLLAPLGAGIAGLYARRFRRA